MSRRVIAVFFVFLLLGMQQAAQWHTLGHLNGWAQRGHEPELSSQQSSDTCALCALFAAGASVAPDSPPSQPSFADGFVAPLQTQSSLTAAAPSYYQSRGPPSLS